MPDHAVSDGLFHFRLATAADVPALCGLLKPIFASGTLGGKLVFGELEIQDGLDWMLPRLIADPQTLLILAEFRPPPGMRSYPSDIAGVAYVQMPHPREVGRLSAEGLSLLRLRMSNRIKDIGLWPTFQTSEVYRRLMGEQAGLEDVRKHGQGARQGHLRFFAVAPKYQGVGIGSRLLAHAGNVVKDMQIRELSFVGAAGSARFVQQCGFSESKAAASSGLSLFVKSL